MTKRDLGRLLYISKIIKPARGFLNRMLHVLRGMCQEEAISIDASFRQDLAWFRYFINTFNSSTSFANWSGPRNVTVFIDASLTSLGAAWGRHFYSAHLPRPVLQQHRIVIFEIIMFSLHYEYGESGGKVRQ